MPDARAIQHPKLKKYIATHDIDPTGVKGHWRKGELVRVDPLKVQPYISRGILVPFNAYLREHPDYQPYKSPNLLKKLETALTPAEPKPQTPAKPTAGITESKPPVEKSFLENKLRSAIQSKKAKLTTEKLAAIQKGGK
jgi:hypothetical protein